MTSEVTLGAGREVNVRVLRQGLGIELRMDAMDAIRAGPRRTDLERTEGPGVQWEVSSSKDSPEPASVQQADYGILFSLVQSGGPCYILCLSSRVVKEQPSTHSVSFRVQPEASGRWGGGGPGEECPDRPTYL